MIKTGIFGGSFNPIHNGHILLAEQFLRAAMLDEVWLLVSPQNPFKSQNKLLDYEKRLEIARQAVGNNSKILVSDYENYLSYPSFTANTLYNLTKDFPQREFSLLVGGDSFEQINMWKNSEYILNNFPIYIYPRDNYPTNTEKLQSNIHIIKASQLNISSTEIRRLIKNNQPISHLLPLKAAILAQQYYKNFDV